MFERVKLEESKERQIQWRIDNPDATIKERLQQASVETQRMLGLEFGLHNAFMMFVVKMMVKYNVWKMRRQMNANEE